MGWDAADRYFNTRATNIADCEHVHIELTNPGHAICHCDHCDPQTNRDCRLTNTCQLDAIIDAINH